MPSQMDFKDRIVLVDGGLARTHGIGCGASECDVQYRAIGNIPEFLRASNRPSEVALVLMPVSEKSLKTVADTIQSVDSPSTPSLPVIVVGPANAPELRVQCFRAGVTDYVDAGSGRDEINKRVRVRLEGAYGGCWAASSSTGTPEHVSRHDEVYRLAVRYLTTTDIGRLSAPSFASRIGVSASILDAAFRMINGCSTARFLRQQRIARAQTLLSSSSLSVTAIAEMLGFSDGANFATAFRQTTGQSPSRFRAAIKGGAVDIPDGGA